MKTLWDEEELKKYNEKHLEKLRAETDRLKEESKSCEIDIHNIRYGGGYPICPNAMECLRNI